jgi:ElaB/YqjD/DUF883 family membrane-anchored ribosome-binding protein
MNEKIDGGAGPALAAHSKDASAPGPTQASSATGWQERGMAAADSVSETVNKVSAQARDAAQRVASSVSEAAGTASPRLSEQGSRTADQGAELVRERPLLALVATGAVCMLLGVLLGRR